MLRVLVFAAALVTALYGQATSPLFDESECFTSAANGGQVTFIADAANSCWYWQCRRAGRGRIGVIPRKCGLGTAVSSFFGKSASNPCTEVFDANAVKFDCTRKKFDLDREPPCVADYRNRGVCKNGGELKFDLSSCWCDCSRTGFADWDCSKTPESLIPAPNVHPNSDDPCPGGVPRTDWCAEAGGNPCQNNGRCTNQCLQYVCDCIAPFTAGKNCESFSCTAGVECLNGGICSRGEGDLNQVARCACSPGFTGMMCELVAQG